MDDINTLQSVKQSKSQSVKQNKSQSVIQDKSQSVEQDKLLDSGSINTEKSVLNRCKICRMLFPDYLTLVGHAALDHFKNQMSQKYLNSKNECCLCNKTFMNETTLILHLARSHNFMKTSDFAETIEGSAEAGEINDSKADVTDMYDIIKGKKRRSESNVKQPALKLHKNK